MTGFLPHTSHCMPMMTISRASRVWKKCTIAGKLALTRRAPAASIAQIALADKDEVFPRQRRGRHLVILDVQGDGRQPVRADQQRVGVVDVRLGDEQRL